MFLSDVIDGIIFKIVDMRMSAPNKGHCEKRSDEGIFCVMGGMDIMGIALRLQPCRLLLWKDMFLEMTVNWKIVMTDTRGW